MHTVDLLSSHWHPVVCGCVWLSLCVQCGCGVGFCGRGGFIRVVCQATLTATTWYCVTAPDVTPVVATAAARHWLHTRVSHTRCYVFTGSRADDQPTAALLADVEGVSLESGGMHGDTEPTHALLAALSQCFPPDATAPVAAPVWVAKGGVLYVGVGRGVSVDDETAHHASGVDSWAPEAIAWRATVSTANSRQQLSELRGVRAVLDPFNPGALSPALTPQGRPMKRARTSDGPSVKGGMEPLSLPSALGTTPLPNPVPRTMVGWSTGDTGAPLHRRWSGDDVSLRVAAAPPAFSTPQSRRGGRWGGFFAGPTPPSVRPPRSAPC